MTTKDACQKKDQGSLPLDPLFLSPLSCQSSFFRKHQTKNIRPVTNQLLPRHLNYTWVVDNMHNI